MCCRSIQWLKMCVQIRKSLQHQNDIDDDGQSFSSQDTMHGFEWKNIRVVEGTGFVRALGHILNSKLADIVPLNPLFSHDN